MDLKNIKNPQDIKALSIEQLKQLAVQMRQAILYRTSSIGGHVGPNLGAVEAMTAMHYVFDAPHDKIVIDVSHQDFPHKMLTGRAYGFLSPEGFAKIGEYTEPSESPNTISSMRAIHLRRFPSASDSRGLASSPAPTTVLWLSLATDP